jgi:hypothetical protein
MVLMTILLGSVAIGTFQSERASADPSSSCVPTSSLALFAPGSACNACPFLPAPNTIPCNLLPQMPTSICSLGAVALNGYPYTLPYSSAGLYPFANNPVTANLASLSRHSSSVCNPAASQSSLPAPTPAPPPASKIQISSTPSILSCGETGYVKIEVMDATGRHIETGQTVTVSTDLGSITPSSGIETGGTLFALLTVPKSGAGAATITATAAGIKGTGQIPFSCGAGVLVSQASLATTTAPAGNNASYTPGRSSVRFTVDVSCFGNRADATVVWTGNDASSRQWVDVSSSYGGWLPGSFTGSGPYQASVSTLLVTNLQPAHTYYVRHNQQISGVWVPSQTYSFTTPPC